MTAVEHFIAELSTRLRVGRRERTRIVSEVRDHFDDAVNRSTDNGATHDVAVAQALASFGSPLALATQFNVQAASRATRRAPFVAACAGAGVFGGFLLAATTQPDHVAPAKASSATEITFFVAVIAFQIAFVAGVCSASRAATLWRHREISIADRAFVRRCAIVCIAALATAALGWATAISLSLDALSKASRVALVSGGVLMFGALAASAVVLTRLPFNMSYEATDQRKPKTGALALGEHLLALVRNHPTMSCGAVAVVGALSAMSHAESTVVGALPWGAVEAAAVVAAFVVLGPILNVRASTPR